MTVSEAKELLLANACCDLAACFKCPYHNTEKCEKINLEMVVEAIETIMEDMKNETGI